MRLRMRRSWLSLGLCAVMGLSACTGRLSNADPDDPGLRDPSKPDTSKNNKPGVPSDKNNVTQNNAQPVRRAQPFACDASLRGPELPLRRLSMQQYRQSVQAILSSSLGSQAGGVMTALGEVFSKLPDDARRGYPGDTHGGFRRLDQALQQEHINVTFEIAQQVAQELTSSDERLARVVGICATDGDDSNDQVCVDEFIRTFGASTLRSPLKPDDVAFYQSVYDAQGISVPGLRDVITVMLTAPQFLYHVEHGQDDVLGQGPQGPIHALDAYELANKLAFHFWQGPPDEALLAAASDGSLLDEQVYKAQLERMIEDERTGSMLRSLFTEWLWLDELPRLDSLVGTPLFDAFAGPNVPSATLRDDMVDEIVALANYYTLKAPGDFAQLLTSQKVLTQSEELAQIYGVKAWDGASEPEAFPAGERAGLITRAALLSTGSANTRPIIKGFFIRKALLCVQPPPPPDNAANFRIELNENMTTREVVEQITEQEGSDCAGCHKIYLNPLGFASEGYDSLGRLRQEQTLFNDAGEIVASKAVDTSSVPRIFLDDLRPSTGIQDVSAMLAESQEVHKCFARNYARFTMGRAEDVRMDGCMLEDLRQQLAEGADMRQVLLSVALRPEFKQRQF